MAINVVLQFPCREFCRSLVSEQSLKGTNDYPAASARTHLPRQVRLLLMVLASLNRSPTDNVLFILSDPARSTSVNVD